MLSVKYHDENIKIYEYPDAKELIYRLSELKKEDFTTVARGGRGRNKVDYFNYPCSFDIETSTIKPGQLDYIESEDAPPIAFPYLFQWNVYGKVITCRTYEESTDVFKMITDAFSLTPVRRMIFFVHNLSFEYFFHKDIWKILNKASFAMDNRRPVTIVTEDGFMFRDSYKMSNMSLETLSKDYGTHYKKEKEIMDYNVLRTPYTPLEDNVYLYSALDVLSLSESIYNFLNARNEPIWTKCPTSTSFNRKNLKEDIGINVKHKTTEQEDYLRMLKKQRINEDIYSLERRIMRGGNTHTNRNYTGVYVEKAYHGDICSSYPTQMVAAPIFPLGKWRKLSPGGNMEDIKLLEENGYCTMFDVVLFNARLKKGVTVPYISISKMVVVQGTDVVLNDNGRYMSGLEAIQLSILGMEWDIIEKQYDFDDAIVTRGYFTNKGYLPDIVRRFVLNLYEKKTKLKNVPDKDIEYKIAKADVNGIYGMCATQIKHLKYEFEDSGINEIDEQDPEFFKKYQNSRSYFVPYIWGCCISAGVRIYLQRMVDAVGDDFLYCDTDSIFAKNPEKSRAAIKKVEDEMLSYFRKCGLPTSFCDVKGVPHELGSIEEEPVVGWKSWGAKKYITMEDGKLICTIAGVPKKKGAEIIGSPDNFKIGLNFPGSITGKLCVWYNDKPPFKLHDEYGRAITVLSNVAMLPVDYLLSITNDYRECLSIEGNFNWKFKEER